MKKITQSLLAGAILFSSLFSANAQELKHCGSTEAMQKLFDANPAMYQEYLKHEAELAKVDQEAFANGYQETNRSMLTPPIYTIPVVFHILHENGTENISDAQVHDAVRILNADFSKTNTDYANTIAAFQGIAVDCEINFRLAQKDPNGICTNGIDRIYSSETNVGDDGSKLNGWPRNKYLNIWVVKTISSGAAGYAYLPFSASAAIDGIMILSTYIGSIGTGSAQRSHALTHEVGHYLNLLHTWGNGNTPAQATNCNGDDGVTDTPNTIGWTSCNLNGTSCSSLDNVQNFMEYSYCSTMYTAGQKTRMRNALTSGTAQRSSLWTSTNLAATGVSLPAVLCQADFINNSVNNMICAGDSIKFTDVAWNGNPTSWSWTFPGGTPSTSNDSTPTITYSTPGIYDVSLTVSDASGSVSTTKTSYVYVNASTAMFSGPNFTESFETAALPNAEWIVKNPNSGSTTWQQTNTAASLGSNCARIVNSTNSVGHVDELISPSINMTLIGGTPTLTYKVAYAQRTSTDADKLQVYVSSNCGKTWQLRQATAGTSLSTGGVVTGSFVPNSTQWLQKSANLSGFVTQPNLYIMFRFTSDGGNNIYLDDINLTNGAVTGLENELTSNLNFTVFPNPATDNATVQFDLVSKQNVRVALIDVLGRELNVLQNGMLNAGEYKLNVNDNTKLASGIYFIQLNVDNQKFTKKLIIE